MTYRPIRSYVLRQGRFSPAQQKAVAELMPRYGVPFREAPVEYAQLFGRRAPVIAEIGFGMGETTATIAASHPENDYLAIEVHGPGVGSLLKRIDEGAIANIRIVQHDAVEVLRHMVAAGSLAAIHVFFPDPWPKKRHHKRRLIQPPFVTLLASRMRSGALLHACTDWEDYASSMLEVLSAEPSLKNTASGYAVRPDTRPQTRFERRGLQLGHVVRDLVFRKN